MAIFPNLILEDTVQTNDKTRLDATKSFVSKDEAAISLVEIEVEDSAGFVTVGAPGVSKNWFLDWQYASAGEKAVTCRITTDAGPVSASFTLNVVAASTDLLFSNDKDLVALEHDIMKWIPDGRNSFLNFHRKAQKLILAWLDENGHWDVNGNRLTAAAFTEVEEANYWSAALCLQLIFSSISNDPNDVYSVKAKQYESMAISHRNRLVLRVDTDGDGTTNVNEGFNMKTLDLVRR